MSLVRFSVALSTVLLVACAAPEADDEVGQSEAAVGVASCALHGSETRCERGSCGGAVTTYAVGNTGARLTEAMMKRYRMLHAVTSTRLSTLGTLVGFRSEVDQRNVVGTGPKAPINWSTHQSGHGIDLDSTSVSSPSVMACFGFAHLGTEYDRLARARLTPRPGDDAAAVSNLQFIRDTITAEAWHFEFDEALEAERLADPSCVELHDRARAILGGDGACVATPGASAPAPATPGGGASTCFGPSHGRAFSQGECAQSRSTRAWSRCSGPEQWDGLEGDAFRGCTSRTPVLLSCDDPSAVRGCRVTATGAATDGPSSYCATKDERAPATDDSKTWRCEAPCTDAMCWR